MRYFLTRIQIEGFRGIHNEAKPFDLKLRHDAVNSVFSANAFGKSSIFDALCYAFKKNIPRFNDIPAADNPEDYYANLFHTSGASTIIVTFKPDNGGKEVEIKVERKADGQRIATNLSDNSDAEGLLSSIDNPFSLLDAKTFYEFVEDSPLSRGRTFSGLLGLEKLSQFRQALAILANAGNLESDFEFSSIQQELNTLKTNIQNSFIAIQSSYKQIMGKDLKGPLDCDAIKNDVTDELKKEALIKSFFEKKDILTVDFDEIDKLVKKTEKSDEWARLAEIILQVESLSALSPSGTENTEQNRLKRLIVLREQYLLETKGELFRKLYEVLIELSESRQWDSAQECPACKSKLDYSLIERAQSILREYKKVVRCQKRIKEAWTKASWVIRFLKIEQSSILALKNEEKLYDTYNTLFNVGDPPLEAVDKAIIALNALETLRVAKISALDAEVEMISKMLPESLVQLTRRIVYAQEIAKGIKAFKADHENVLKKKIKLVLLRKWEIFIQSANGIFSQAEANLSIRKTEALKGQYGSLYADITQNPDIVPILQKAKGTENLHLLLANFYGRKNVSATPVLSESYRNAFAISVFLSAILQSISKARFLVLDDVTSSFDGGHQLLLMEILRTKIAYPNNQTGPQVIIFSHDGLLEKYFSTLTNHTDWYHQRLEGSCPKGYLCTNPQEIGGLRKIAEDLLGQGKVKEAEPLVRPYFEYRLLRIIRNVGISVPIDMAIRDDRHMVKNCIDAITNAISLYEKANDIILDPTQISNATVNIPQVIGNWLSHYETQTVSSLNQHVVQRFFSAIDDFADCFKYDCKCSGIPQRKYYKSLSEKGCSC